MKKIRLPNLIKEILLNKEMTSQEVYEALLNVTASYGRYSKKWKYTPSKQQVVSVLSSGLHPFKRVNPKKDYPAIWTYEGEHDA
jgi:hypothetical protein